MLAVLAALLGLDWGRADDLQRILRPERGLPVPDLGDLADREIEIEGAPEEALVRPDEREPGIGRLTRGDDELVVGPLGDEPDAPDVTVLHDVAVTPIIRRTA